MRAFSWLGAGPVPAAHDLGRRGWRLSDAAIGLAASAAPPRWPIIAAPETLASAQGLAVLGGSLADRQRLLVLGIAGSAERVRLLRLGCGEVLPNRPSLVELELRASDIVRRAESLPRRRHFGPIALDLFLRDAVVAGRRLGLHPREFALLWRLAEEPGTAVGVNDLLGDVWQLRFRPETNSLAVHISRLRARLRLAGVDGMIETLPGGAYRLVVPALTLARDPSGELALDAYVRLGKVTARIVEDGPNEPRFESQ